MSKLRRLKDKSMSMIFLALQQEYRMRGEFFPVNASPTDLANKIFEVEMGVIGIPGKSLFFWSNDSIDVCLKYIEMSGMVRHRKTHALLLEEQKRRETAYVRIPGEESAVDIRHC